MSKTRSYVPETPSSNGYAFDGLQAAAQSLEVKSQGSLLYNAQTIDYLINTAQGGSATALAWYYWGRFPELRYTTRYISNALSMASLYVGEKQDPGSEPVRLSGSHPASDLMNSFAGGPTGQSELLDRLGLHLTVVGDSVLMGPSGSASYQEPFNKWDVWSTEEVSSRNGKIFVRLPYNAKEQPIPTGILPVRIWRQHPVYKWDSESPVKGAFSVLEELDILDRHVKASGNSRLSGAGMLGIPEELDLPGSDLEVDGTDADRFVAFLTDVMSMAIKNPGTAAARVPIILRGPADYIEKIQHFDFSTEFSQAVPDLRMTAIRRIALGMDIPPEILLGNAGTTGWSAWQIDESTLRLHIVPLLRLITSSLTDGWLRPMLEELPLSKAQKEQIPNLEIGFDISDLKIRQDISGDAQALYDRFEIDSDALRLATGYGPNSIPDDKELAKQILFKLLEGTPEQANYAINALRDNFGIKLLPEPAKPEVAPEGRTDGFSPGVSSPDGSETPGGAVPGDRSQDKQVAPPPVPKISDENNNEPGI